MSHSRDSVATESIEVLSPLEEAIRASAFRTLAESARTAGPIGAENRGARRSPCHMLTQVLVVGPVPSLLKVAIRDLSRRGAGLWTPCHIDPPGLLIIALRHGERTILAQAQVRRCRPVTQGAYHVGVEFLAAATSAAGEEKLPLEWMHLEVTTGGLVQRSDAPTLRRHAKRDR